MDGLTTEEKIDVLLIERNSLIIGNNSLVAKCDQYLVENADLEATIVELKDENAELRERVKVPSELVELGRKVVSRRVKPQYKNISFLENEYRLKLVDWAETIIRKFIEQEGGE